MILPIVLGLFPVALISLLIWHKGGPRGFGVFVALMACAGVALYGLGLALGGAYFGNTYATVAGLGLALAGLAAGAFAGWTYRRDRNSRTGKVE